MIFITKRALVPDITKTFDILGWFSPATTKVKTLLQKVWEAKVDWDDPVPSTIKEVSSRWREELPDLAQEHIPRCYFDIDKETSSLQIHRFSDASESAYSAVVYLRATDTSGEHLISLITSKTKAAPIRRLSIPRLELCHAHLLAKLIHHVKTVLDTAMSSVFAWTDSTIMLNWLDGSPKRFKIYVGNRISTILDLLPPDKWATCRRIRKPSRLCIKRYISLRIVGAPTLVAWSTLAYRRAGSLTWPKQNQITPNIQAIEGNFNRISNLDAQPVITIDRYSCFIQFKRITAWILRLAKNSKIRDERERIRTPLTTMELKLAENYWIKLIQACYFNSEVEHLSSEMSLPKSSSLTRLNPFLDDNKLLRVGGQRQLSHAPYTLKHSLIVRAKHRLTLVIILTEHLRLLHAGPTLLTSSINGRYHIVGGLRAIKSVTRKCVICWKYGAKPQPQMLGQLPLEQVSPGMVFEKVGVDYAGHVSVKYGYKRKLTIMKAYICIFVSLSVKAVHMELVTELTSDAFIACLRRFIARREPHLIWSDNGTNFVGADRQIKELYKLLEARSTQEPVSKFLSAQNMEWKFIPEHSPRFGGLWEAAVKSTKTHLRKLMGDIKLTYEEMCTLRCQTSISYPWHP